jgi:VCBS repeat-containing protein
MTSFVPDAAASNQIFFISDGNPNQQLGTGGTSLTDSTAAAWNTFVDDNGINVTSIGVGGGIDTDRLQDVDVDGSGAVINVSGFDTLVTALLAAVTPAVVPVEGNVITNDGAGTDQPLSAVDWSAATNAATITALGQYGTLLLESNGHYKFTLDNSAAATQALDNGDMVEKVLYYSVQDADGDSVTSTLTICIEGTNDSPTVNADTNWAQEDVSNASGNMLLTLAHNGAPDSVGRGDVADTDVDDPLTISSVTGGNAYGTLTWSANGIYSYALDNSNAAVQSLDDGEKLTEAYTYTVTDGTVPRTATLIITIFGSNDAPSIVVNSAALSVYESGLPQGSNSVANTETTTGYFTVGDSDGLADIKSITIAGSILNVGGGGLAGLVGTVVDTGYGKLTLSSYSNGLFNYSYSLDATVDNDTQALANDLNYIEVIALSVSDGTASANTSINVTIYDDAPLTLVPLRASVNNSAGAVGIAGLDVDSNIDNNTGADQLGSITFTTLDGTLSGVKSGGLDVRLYVSTDGKSLIGSTALTEAAVLSTNTVFTVAINQDASFASSTDRFTVSMFGSIDNGAGSTFSNLSGGDAGNPPFKIIESTTADSLELLFTPINAGSVNSDSDDVAVGSQFIDIATPDMGLRIDFGDFTYVANGGGSSDDGFTINQHTLVNGFRFSIDQVSGGTTADVVLKARNANEGSPNETIGSHDFVDDPLVAINKVKIFNNLGVLLGIATADATFAGVSVDFNPTGGEAGSVLIKGLLASYSVITYSASGYDRLEVLNAGTSDGGSTDGKFSLSHLSVETTNTGSSVDLSFGVKLTDADGDFTTANLSVTVEPEALTGNNSINGTASADTLYGGAGNDTLSGLAGSDKLYGGSGNDNLLGGADDDFLIGGVGNDTLTGGAGKDTFVWQSGDSGTDHITNLDFFIDTPGVAGGNSDVLDLSQLLSGEHANAGSLDSFLNFAFAGGSTTISVSAVSAGPVVQTIVLDGIDLHTAAYYGAAATDASIITGMLNDNALKVDA